MRLPIRARGWLLAAPALALGLGCGRVGQESPAPEPRPLPVVVFADTGVSIRLPRGVMPEARVWLERVTPAAPRAGDRPEPPEARPESVAAGPPPPPEPDPDLEPPILRRPARLVIPESGRARREAEVVELDVLVDENGVVAEVEWAGGSGDSLLIEAARQSALAMQFYPARRKGWPVAVWCRQRFDFER